jgi:hypothetical protein
VNHTSILGTVMLPALFKLQNPLGTVMLPALLKQWNIIIFTYIQHMQTKLSETTSCKKLIQSKAQIGQLARWCT